MNDSNHDIVPTLRMYDGVMMKLAAMPCYSSQILAVMWAYAELMDYLDRDDSALPP